MNLIFFINTLGGGGAEKVLVDLVNQLPQDKYKITVITLLNGIHEKSLAAHINYKSIIRTNNAFMKSILMRIYCKLLPHRIFARLFLNAKCDIMISYLEGFNTQILYAYKGNAKRVAFVHCNTGVDSDWTKIYSTTDNCLHQYQSFDRVCFVSNDALYGFEKVVGHLNNSCVIHNVIDFNSVVSKAVISDSAAKIMSATNLKLITVGRLTHVKGYVRLLKVIARLRNENLDCELYICGEGDERSKLQAMIDSLALSNVHLLGFHPNPYQFIVLSDIYVCASYSEGYSTAVAESVALGVPVLTTDCSGMREILKEGELGVIVENSEDGIYNGLKNLILNEKYRRTLKNIVLQYSYEISQSNSLSEYVELFENL